MNTVSTLPRICLVATAAVIAQRRSTSSSACAESSEVVAGEGSTMGIMEWDQVSQGRPGDEWLVATENGLGVMAAWAAGTVNVRKMPVDDQGRTVVVECHDSDGHVRAWTEQFTVADRELVDEEIESYLLDAGVPLPPRGWVWLIRRPVIFRDDRQLWAHLNQRIAQHASPVPRPSEIAPLLQRAMAELYAGG